MGLCLIQLHLGQPVWTESSSTSQIWARHKQALSLFHPSICSCCAILFLNHPLHVVATALSSCLFLPPFWWHSAIILVCPPVALTLLPFLASQTCSTLTHALSLYYCQSSEACSQTLLKHSSPVCWLIYLLFCLTVPCLRHFLSVKQGNQPCLLWHTSCSPTKLIFNHRLSKSKTAKVLVKRKNKN